MGRVMDADRVLQLMCAIARYDGEPGDDGLPREVLQMLGDLVACDNLWVSGQDTPRWDFFVSQQLHPLEMAHSLLDALGAVYRRFYWESDCSYPDRTGEVTSILRVSDRVGRIDRRNSPMYAEYDRPMGIEHELRVVLSADGVQRTVRLMFVRGGRPDFSDRDVAVLTLLRPHLQELWARVERKRGEKVLTARQAAVVRGAAQGLTNAQIASRLGISEGTVRKHLENAYARLQVTNRSAAASALRGELISKSA